MWINVKEEKMILKTTFFCHRRKQLEKDSRPWWLLVWMDVEMKIHQRDEHGQVPQQTQKKVLLSLYNRFYSFVLEYWTHYCSSLCEG